MYKKRIAKWGLDKRNKENEMRAIVRKYHRRAAKGKSSQIRVRGTAVEIQEIHRYWKRKGVSIDDVVARRTFSATPEAVQCFTPLKSPVTTPEPLARPEQMIVTICNYCDGSFDAGTWVRRKKHCSSMKSPSGGRSSLMVFCQLLQTACQAFNIGASQEAGQTMIFANGLIDKILFAEKPVTLEVVFHLMLKTQRLGRPEVGTATLRQFFALGEIVLGKNHPLRLACGWLASMAPHQWEDVVSGALQALGDQFERVLGPLHPSTQQSRIRHIECGLVRGVKSDQSVLQDQWRECVRALGPYDFRTLSAHHALVKQFQENGDLFEVKHWSHSLIASAKKVQSLRYSTCFSAAGLVELGYSEWELQDRVSAISHMRAAINLFASASSVHNIDTLPYLVTLESWLSEQGQSREAAEMGARRKGIIDPAD
ncbi:hypothetical protein MMC20_002788 [Loxospora ochrophaea]|nr:hypothetical protein [Loxospora ochrophaea]